MGIERNHGIVSRGFSSRENSPTRLALEKLTARDILGIINPLFAKIDGDKTLSEQTGWSTASWSHEADPKEETILHAGFSDPRQNKGVLLRGSHGEALYVGATYANEGDQREQRPELLSIQGNGFAFNLNLEGENHTMKITIDSLQGIGERAVPETLVEFILDIKSKLKNTVDNLLRIADNLSEGKILQPANTGVAA